LLSPQINLFVQPLSWRPRGSVLNRSRLQRLHRIQRLLGARLIHLLDRLERQHYVADRVGLAVPDQLHLAFVFKQQEAVFSGNG
jgi:hypothetical protein